jgi:response regulator RpfG family c-di-GMP phosphodiesterase
MNANCAHRILYVDDEPALLRAFSRTMRDLDFPVDVAPSGPDALRQIEQNDYAVVISDFNMPGMNGASVFRRCRDLAPDAWRILVTGYRTFDVVSLVVNEGAVDRVIGKPWDRSELRQAVVQGIQHHRLVRETRHQGAELATRSAALETYSRDLEGRVHERSRQILDTLMSALDLRDPDTARFCRRVATYARRIASELGLSGQDLLDMERGALLHDIGKIGVQDAVLLKPGALCDAEWQEMYRHPELGYQLLLGIDFLQGASLIVYHHQERWDGTGYPQRLRGEQICLGARILAVADTLDAVTSNRPYRKARSFQAAREEIVRASGTQFDPSVVEAYLRVDEREWDELRRNATPDAEPLPADAPALTAA